MSELGPNEREDNPESVERELIVNQLEEALAELGFAQQGELSVPTAAEFEGLSEEKQAELRDAYYNQLEARDNTGQPDDVRNPSVVIARVMLQWRRGMYDIALENLDDALLQLEESRTKPDIVTLGEIYQKMKAIVKGDST